MASKRGVYNAMFEQSIVTPTQTAKPWSFALSLTLQAAGITGLILLPMIYTEHLSQALIRGGIMMPSVPQPKAPVTRVAQASAATAARPQPRSASTLLNFIRNHTPRPLAEIIMDPAPVTGVAMSSTPAIGGGGMEDGVISGLGDPAVHTPPPPPPAVQQQQPAERKAPPQVMRVGGDVLGPRSYVASCRCTRRSLSRREFQARFD